jgi:hypothetical protein
MDFDLNEDQAALLSGIQRLTSRYREIPPGTASEYVLSPGLERELKEAGFLDIAREDGMGPIEASLLIEEIAKLPFAVEIAASAMVAPQLSLAEMTYPLAMARAPLTGPVRFASSNAGVLVDCGDQLKLLPPQSYKAVPSRSSFAYPYARLTEFNLDTAPVVANADPRVFRQWWRVALCFEIIGAGQAALDLVVQYVKDRRQFGRPIGTFQVIKHRLSECAMYLAGARQMARYAAYTRDPGEAALAAGYCQEAAARLAYEAAQFHGAIGITLEYPLHFWTYRLRALQGELGGSSSSFVAAAETQFADTSAA